MNESHAASRALPKTATHVRHNDLSEMPDQAPDPSIGSRRAYRVLKRLMDITVALIMLALFGPVMLLVAVLIRLDSQGPALFVQDRVGYDTATGLLKPIRVYKFRSMRATSDENIHRAYVTRLIKDNARPAGERASLKMANDPRVTRFGRLLRKSSLDELPQLLNVLKGEMSLVGPRPALPYEVAQYEDWHRKRLRALPGITGWWQVKGRNVVSFDDMVHMDIYYIENRSLLLDLKILMLTPLAVLTTRGAG